MKVLLTGRDGQIGACLLRLLGRAHDVWATGRNEFDLSRAGNLPGVLDDFAPEIIVNAAAYTNVDGAESERDLAFAVNAHAPAAMATWAAENGAAIIHYSSDYVYDGSGKRPWSETDATGPVNAYGESKLAGDLAIVESGAPHMILRTSWIYAARGRNFLHTMLRLGMEREELAIVGDQIGAPTSAELVASVTADIIAKCTDAIGQNFSSKGGILNCAASGETSWFGFAEAIFEEARLRGMALKVKQVDEIGSAAYPTPAKRPENSRLSLDRLNAEFGIKTPSWRKGLCDVLDVVLKEKSA